MIHPRRVKSFKIEKGVPLPELPPAKMVYPFRAMEAGDSFFVPAGAEGIEAVYRRVKARASLMSRQLGFLFLVCEDATRAGVRVWRIDGLEEGEKDALKD